MVKIAVIGIGYWGPNLVRNFSSLSNVQVTVLCDYLESSAHAVRSRFCPQAKVFSDYQKILQEDIDAVVIATPIQTHAELGKFFLKAGKHVL